MVINVHSRAHSAILRAWCDDTTYRRLTASDAERGRQQQRGDMIFHDTLALLGGEKVFGRAVNSALDFATEVARGLPSASLDHAVAVFAAHGVPSAAIYELIGTTRALVRKRRHYTRLSRDESDRLSRLARVSARAAEALGDAHKGARRLNTAHRALVGRRPITLLASDAGTTVVVAVLGRIEHAVPS